MVDFVTTGLVIGIFGLLTAGFASRFGRRLAPLVWLAFAEYFACAVIQYFFGEDATTYRRNGVELARLLDLRFDWASGELWALLFHRPSALDSVILGAGTNTASMSAAAGWLTFLVQGSTYAAQALVAGLAMVSTLALFDVLREECPDVPHDRVFLATVLFPSIAFWSAAFHKESFCLMGTAVAARAWRAARRRQLRALPLAAVGLTTIALFRAPALPPLLLGVATYFVVRRTRSVQGVAVTLLGPLYAIIGLLVIGGGLIAIGQVAPSLGIDRLGESIAHQQQGWSTVQGGSSFEMDDAPDTSLAGQLLLAPIGLMNALLRPQLFDVRNPLMVISALEMTVVAFLLVQALRRSGALGLVRRIQSSPIAAMCAIVTVVGLTLVGLTTRNFGSLARYRVPFLPFYGCLLAILTCPESEPSFATARRPAPQRPSLGTAPVARRARPQVRRIHQR